MARDGNFRLKRGIADSILRQTARDGIGGVAQLGERLHGMQEVRGSSPLTSITIKP